jgi:L-aminopeptidase/D-esterase-like protein
MDEQRISDLTISQFKQLIRQTVQEAVAEVMIEFHAVAEAEEQLRYEAEITDYLRNNLQRIPMPDGISALKSDD